MSEKARRRPACLLQRWARRAGLAVALFAPLSGSGGWAQDRSDVARLGAVSAWFQDPTDRYGHAVLGDTQEWGTVCLDDGSGAACHTLPLSEVFEDLAPRLVDVDLDGDVEVLVVNSSLAGGARLEIYDRAGRRAQTTRIGRRNRWYAPVGAADLDGDGVVELAFVDRPHLAKTLRVWQYRGGELSEVAYMAGLTNHRIGDAFLVGGLRDCPDGVEMILVDASWSTIKAIRWTGRRLVSRDVAVYRSPADASAARAC